MEGKCQLGAIKSTLEFQALAKVSGIPEAGEQKKSKQSDSLLELLDPDGQTLACQGVTPGWIIVGNTLQLVQKKIINVNCASAYWGCGGHQPMLHARLCQAGTIGNPQGPPSTHIFVPG